MADLPNKELLRVEEVAAYFRVARSTVYLWIDHGILAAEKYHGGTIRVPRESVLHCRIANKLDPLG
jgi:excisionase family DNA binding protein